MARRRSPVTAWFELARKAQETLWASSLVVAQRTQRMAAASAPPSARDATEFARMWPEKVAAARTSARRVAATAGPADLMLGANLFGVAMSAWSAYAALMTSTTPGQYLDRQRRLATALVNAGRTTSVAATRSARMATAALEPYHSASRGNARRLARAAVGRTRT